MQLEPSQQIIKIEKDSNDEEGIDCQNPGFTHLLFKVKQPNIKNVRNSFLDSKTNNLIVFSDKIFFIKLDEFMKNVKTTEQNLDTLAFGNNLNQRILEEINNQKGQEKTSDTKANDGKDNKSNDSKDQEGANKPQENPDILLSENEYQSIDSFSTNSFEYSPQLLSIINENTFKHMKYLQTFNPDDIEKTLNHLFFVDHFLIIINQENRPSKTIDLKIRAHTFNQFSVSNYLQILILYFCLFKLNNGL